MRREHFDLEAGAQSAFLSTHQSCAFIVEETRNGVINLSTLFFFLLDSFKIYGIWNPKTTLA